MLPVRIELTTSGFLTACVCKLRLCYETDALPTALRKLVNGFKLILATAIVAFAQFMECVGGTYKTGYNVLTHVMLSG